MNNVEENALTLQVLYEIRDEQRATRVGLREVSDELRARRRETKERFAVMDQRFLVIETALRDLSEQLVMLVRGIEVVIEGRAELAGRIEDHDRRLLDLEKRQPR